MNTGRTDLLNNLKRIAESGHVSHAYIFDGENAAQLRETAEAFVKMMEVTAADVLFLEHEKPNLISVDDIRRCINQSVHIKPYNSEHKVYIVPEAEKMNVQAQNALLKTLEEPPSYVVILLLTANSETFLPTILSRCVKLAVISEETQAVEDEDREAVLSLVRDVVRAVPTMDTKLMLDDIAAMEKLKVHARDALEEIRLYMRDVLIYKSTKDVKLLAHREEVTAVKQIADRASFEGIERILTAIDGAGRRLDANVNFELTIQLLLMTMRDEVKKNSR